MGTLMLNTRSWEWTHLFLYLRDHLTGCCCCCYCDPLAYAQSTTASTKTKQTQKSTRGHHLCCLIVPYLPFPSHPFPVCHKHMQKHTSHRCHYIYFVYVLSRSSRSNSVQADPSRLNYSEHYFSFLLLLPLHLETGLLQAPLHFLSAAVIPAVECSATTRKEK